MIKIPYLTTKISTDILVTILLAPLWWITGLSIVIYHVISILLIMKLLVTCSINGAHIKMPKVTMPLGMFIIIYGVSIFINLSYNESGRTIASLYNLSFWVIGFFIIIIIYNAFSINGVKDIAKVLTFNNIIIGVLAVVVIVMWGAGHRMTMKYPTPIFLLVSPIQKITHLAASATITILSYDWFNQSRMPRLSIMAPYYTALGGLMVIVLPFVAWYIKNNAFKVAIVGLGIIPLVFSLSRLSVLALLLAIAVVLALNQRYRIGIILLIIIVVFLVIPYFGNMVERFHELRPGSSATRIDLYRYSFEEVLRRNFLLGVGAKPRETSFAIPIGSHSTYMSVFFRTGILGFGAFFAFQLSVFFYWLRLRRKLMDKEKLKLWAYVGVAFIAISLWLFGEDLDAPQLVAFLYFILVGIVAVLGKKEELVAAS